ncbi:hypothetical protein SDC9_69030 [bioreactor metagenome]|uniref:Uncharacterized protein n=1 Tax=bioreactor metagenome TaxID=1076179 RepID=A0A644Y7M5_9ZZZZ
MAAQQPSGQLADVARANGLDQPQQNAADHCAAQVADAAEHGCGEGLEPRQKAHGVLRRAVVGGVHDAGNGRQDRADDEGGRDHHVGLHTHQRRHLRVLCRGTHRAAQLGVIHQIDHRRQRHHGGHQNQDLRGRDHRTAQVIGVGRQQRRVGLVVGLPDDHRNRLQQDGHADRRDQRSQARTVAQPLVGHLFNREVECRSHDAGDDGGDQQHHPTRGTGHGFLHHADAAPTGERPDHEHFTVREIDQLNDAVHHRIAEGYEGVHAAENQTVDDLLQQNIHNENPS